MAAISRFAPLIDGLLNPGTGFLLDLGFREIVERDLRDGQHRNPTSRPGWFTTAYFHLPDELREEVGAAGLEVVDLVGIEGPGALVPDLAERWRDAAWREALLFAARAVESEPAMQVVRPSTLWPWPGSLRDQAACSAGWPRSARPMRMTRPLAIRHSRPALMKAIW